MLTMPTTQVDIIVLGATGYTGSLISKYLANHPSRRSFSFAIAGRSLKKLQALANDLSLSPNVAKFAFDVGNDAEVVEVVKKAKVIINCIGPFWKCSTPIVQACSAHGIHYVDICGESWWIKEMIDRYDYQAMKNKTIMVPSLGFDSAPSDLAVFLSARTLAKKHGSAISLGSSVTTTKRPAGVSGGTLSTLLSVFDLPWPKRQEINSSGAYYLTPIKGTPRPFYLARSIPFSSKYGGMDIMAPANEKIVNRTWGLLEARSLSTSRVYSQGEEDAEFCYGPNFLYEEYREESSWITGAFVAITLFTGLAAMALLPPLRWLLKWFGPQPGSGPEKRPGDQVILTNVTATDFPNPDYVKTTVTFQGGPYILSAYTCAESALAILFDRDQLPSMAKEGGILTPMTALGDVLVKRLVDSGNVSIDSQPIRKTK